MTDRRTQLEANSNRFTPRLPHSEDNNTVSSNEISDETWLDFLRSAANTVPIADHESSTSPTHQTERDPSASASASRTGNNPSERDRKRRLASAGQGRRDYPYDAPGNSSHMPIDLTHSSPAAQRQQQHTHGERRGYSQHRQSMSGTTQSRSGSEVAMPQWQPDDAVTKCPICETEFGLFFRKHHCRKCGRVVCNNCSPHRITIPREYVVSPNAGSEGFSRNSGAEIVRVCKPCVPDPWSPRIAAQASTTQSNQAPQQQQQQQRPHSQPSRQQQPGGLAAAVAQQSAPFQDLVERLSRESISGPLTTMSPSERRTMQEIASLLHPMTPQEVETFSTRAAEGSPLSAEDLVRTMRERRPAPPPPPQQIDRLQRISEEANNRARYGPSGRPTPPQPQGLATSSSPNQRQPPRRRREVREEDECPVCGIELPPGESVREAHIQECITTRFSSPPPAPPSPAVAFGSTPPAPPPGSIARARATSYRSRGIFPYVATEKDCLDSEGREVECTICMEEFHPGAEMGRLECLCRYHRSCIREWWRVKGPGSCPVHVGPAEN